jgi:L-amino acid N-acyltransferase YncA
MVRPSTDGDVPAMLAIYAHCVQRDLGEFNFEPLDGDDIKRRRKNMVKHRLPHLVAERLLTYFIRIDGFCREAGLTPDATCPAYPYKC